MRRFYQCFMTQEERSAWEKEQKRLHPAFKVCFHNPVSLLEQDMGMPKGTLAPYKYATVYRFKED